MFKKIIIIDNIEDRKACNKAAGRNSPLWFFTTTAERVYYFDSHLYEEILKDFNKKLKSKWILLQFRSDNKIISELRKFIDSYYYFEDYHFKYRLKGTIKVWLPDLNYNHAEYIITLYELTKDRVMYSMF